ncbi:MAG: VOC family protein [Chloroflexota bacterium]
MVETSLKGLTLHVADVEKSIEFYSRIAGAHLERHRPGEFALFRIGSGSLHLAKLGGKTRFHIELEADDVNAMHKQLLEAGLEPTTPKHHPWGKTDFKLTDPDGNQLEFGVFEGNE